MTYPAATQALITLKGDKATIISGTDLDMTITDAGLLVIYDYPADRSHTGPVFAASPGEWLSVALQFPPQPQP